MAGAKHETLYSKHRVVLQLEWSDIVHGRNNRLFSTTRIRSINGSCGIVIKIQLLDDDLSLCFLNINCSILEGKESVGKAFCLIIRVFGSSWSAPVSVPPEWFFFIGMMV